MKNINTKIKKRNRRHKKIRTQISGTSDRPRISVYKSNKFIYAQLIDDEKNITLAAASTKDLKGKTMRDRATEAGKTLALKALGKKIKKAVFDRGGFIYTGSIKAFADGARAGGLKF